MRNALRNAHNEANLVLNCLNDRVGSAGGRHVQDRCVGLGLANGLKNRNFYTDCASLNAGDMKYLLHRTEHWQAEMRLASLLRGNAADHLGAKRQRFLRVESSLRELLSEDVRTKTRQTHSLPCEALAENFCVFVDEEVLNGTFITPARGRLGERPASSWESG